MKIIYYEEDDILFMEFTKGTILYGESLGWNVNIDSTSNGIGEITVLDAQKKWIVPFTN